MNARTLIAATLIASIFALILPGFAQGQTFDPRREAMAKLSRTITVDFEEARLEDVFEFVVTVSQVDIEPLWIDDQFTEGLDPELEVSLSAKGASVLSVVERILAKSQITDFEGNSWQFSETGALVVGPKSRLNRDKRLEIYDIQDLLFQVNNYAEVPELDLDAAIQQGGQGGGGGGGGSIFEDTEEEDEQDNRSDADKAQDVIDLIVEFVEPDQWRDNGGDGGSITYYRGTLLIRAPDYMHRQLGGYSFWPARLERAASARAADYARAEARARRAIQERAQEARAAQQNADQSDSD